MSQVTGADVERLGAELKPGRIYTCVELFDRYCSQAEAAGQVIGSPMGLGLALKRAGWTKKIIRKGRGPRGKQKFTETHCWAVPGAMPVDLETERMAIVLRELGDGFHGHYRIVDLYSRKTRELGWTWALDDTGIARWLGRNGFVRQKHQGAKTWDIDLARVDMLTYRPIPTGATR